MSYDKPLNNLIKLLQFKIPTLPVYSIEEYEALSDSDKVWFGLYKVPYALPSEFFDPDLKGWNCFYKKIKKQYPIQYFLREWLFSNDNPLYFAYNCWVYWPLRDFKHAVKRWLHPFHPRWRDTLPRHAYMDITELVVVSNFNLIRDFYWEEVVDGFVDWSSQDDHKIFHDKLVSYVDWIENTLPKLKEECKEALSNVSSSTEKDYHKKYAEVIRIEDIIQNKETEILNWFVENRAFFWS